MGKRKTDPGRLAWVPQYKPLTAKQMASMIAPQTLVRALAEVAPPEEFEQARQLMMLDRLKVRHAPMQ